MVAPGNISSITPNHLPLPILQKRKDGAIKIMIVLWR
jgi:hypothetical protein